MDDEEVTASPERRVELGLCCGGCEVKRGHCLLKGCSEEGKLVRPGSLDYQPSPSV